MSFAKSLLLGAFACGMAGVGTANGAYYIEAENYTDILGSPSPAPIVRAEGTGPFSGEQMSGDAYLEVVSGSYTTFQIPANTIPAGTYYPAVRSDSGGGHGIFIDRATSLETPLGTFGVYGLTYNPESGTPGVFGWDWVEDYNNSNAFVSITINPGEANTLRINSATGGNISVDLIAFLDNPNELPPGVPEPASLGLIVVAGAMLMRRRD